MNRLVRHRLSRHAYLGLAWVCVGLAIVGALLPLLPTTVFLLIAAWAFARSAPARHAWLRAHPRVGHLICAWEDHHAMPRRAKRIALLTLALCYAITAYLFGPLSPAALLGGLCMVAVAVYLAQLPVLREDTQPARRSN